MDNLEHEEPYKKTIQCKMPVEVSKPECEVMPQICHQLKAPVKEVERG